MLVLAASRSLAALAVAAAAMAAVAAHATIDVIADYLVAHASYDDVSSHDSRVLVGGVALAIAGFIALRALKMCCEDAAVRAFGSARPPSWRSAPAFAATAMLLSSFLVPAMEFVDTTLARKNVGSLADAFGGSTLLGLGTTLLCALTIGIAVFAIARFLLSHRHRIVAAIVAIVGRSAPAGSASRFRRFDAVVLQPLQCSALPRGMRAPPRVALATTPPTHTHEEGNRAFSASCGVLPRRRQRPFTRRRTDRTRAAGIPRPGANPDAQRSARQFLGPRAARPLRPYR